MNRDILTLIQENMHTFSKGQKRIASFILESYDKAAFMTASKLGKKVNVSESTVVRFAAELGYDGYPDMQRSLQKMIRNRLTSVQRIEVTNDRLGDQDLLSMVLQSDIEKIRLTLEELDRDSFEKAVDAIVSARKLYIIGVRSCAAMATFMSFYFNLIFDNVVKVSATTASEVSPLSPISTYTLKARSDMASFVDSLVAPLSLINALLVAVSRKKNDDLANTFEDLEKIWEEYGVYEKVQE